MPEHDNDLEGDLSPEAQHSTSAPSPSAGKTGKGRLSRSRLGCMTCRKRKVKCDEVHPRYGQCKRLQPTCFYQPVQLSARSKTRKKTTSSTQRSNKSPNGGNLPNPSAHDSADNIATESFTNPHQPSSFDGSDQWPLSTAQKSVGSETWQLVHIGQPLSVLPTLDAANTSWLSGDTSFPVGEDLWHPDVFGEESFWTRLPIFSNLSTGQDPSIFENLPRSDIDAATTLNDGGPVTAVLDSTAGSTGPSNGRSDGSPRHNPVLRGQVPSGDSQTSPNSVLSSDIPPYEISLLRHFVDFAVPPILIGVEPRWTSARHALFKVAKSDCLVRHAICSFSALSLADESDTARSKGSNPPSKYFYDLALIELRAEIDSLTGGNSDTRRHENVLASIFFLSYVELMMSSGPKHTLELLSRAYAISRDTQPSKSLLGNQLRIWLKLLDARVVSAGGEGIHLVSNPQLKDLEGPSDGRESPTESVPNDEAPLASEAPQVGSEDILFNSINHSAYNFYVQVLDFAGRIAHLDRWHRPRGSVADELEVMQAAQKILGDLEELWGRRPAILNLASLPHDQVAQHLSARLARNVQTHLRTYVANFYACFVHVQRALYPHLPTTPQTSDAVGHIVALVRLCERDRVKLSVSMLWPLMMAGCEAPDVGTRDWLITTVEAMNGGLGNTARTAKLIREICRRQEGDIALMQGQ